MPQILPENKQTVYLSDAQIFVVVTAGARASLSGLRGQAGGGAAHPKTLRAACDREEVRAEGRISD